MLAVLMIMLLGLFFIYLEFYLPGGIMGALGSLILVANIIYYVLENGSAAGTLVLIMLSLGLLVLVIKLALSRIKAAKPEDSIYLNADQEGFRASSYNDDLVGCCGEALSDLGPSGFVMIKGQRMQVVSKQGYIKRGSAVEVIGGSGAHLEVKVSK